MQRDNEPCSVWKDALLGAGGRFLFGWEAALGLRDSFRNHSWGKQVICSLGSWESSAKDEEEGAGDRAAVWPFSPPREGGNCSCGIWALGAQGAVSRCCWITPEPHLQIVAAQSHSNARRFEHELHFKMKQEEGAASGRYDEEKGAEQTV